MYDGGAHIISCISGRAPGGRFTKGSHLGTLNGISLGTQDFVEDIIVKIKYHLPVLKAGHSLRWAKMEVGTQFC